MSTVCCICQQQFSSESNKKNIFKDDLLIHFDSENDKEMKDAERTMKLYSGIELITHHKIFETNGSHLCLCDLCFQKLEGFINFREQLLSSFGTIFDGQSSFIPLKPKFLETHLENRKPDDSPKINEFEFFADKISDCSKLSECKLAFEDTINIDESSTSLDVDSVRNDEEGTNDSINCSRLQNDQENNNLNDSESSNDNIDVQNFEDSPARVQDNDIESEIDVCSADDDEILEMQDQSIKENVSEALSSSESEIEVCDYEPTGKRIKNVNSLSQPVLF